MVSCPLLDRERQRSLDCARDDIRREPLFPIHFHTALGGIHPAPLARPFSKGLLMEQIHSLFLLYRFEDPSCAFGAALLQGPTHGAESLSFPFIPLQGSILRLWRGPSPRAYSWSGVLSFPFIPLRGSILCLRRGLSPRAYSWSGVLSFPFIPLRGSILRLWRAPSSRGYSISKTPFFHLNPSHQSLVTKKGKEPASADSFPRSCFQP